MSNKEPKLSFFVLSLKLFFDWIPKGEHMGWNVRRSRQIVPGVRLNFSKRGLGLSVGPKHAKISVSPGRRVTTNVGIPGTGIRYTNVVNAKQQSRVNQKAIKGHSYQIDGVDHVEIYKPGSISSYLMALSFLGLATSFAFFIGNVSGSHYKNAFNSFLIVMAFSVLGGIFAAVRPKIAVRVNSET